MTGIGCEKTACAVSAIGCMPANSLPRLGRGPLTQPQAIIRREVKMSSFDPRFAIYELMMWWTLFATLFYGLITSFT
jgi:hypothetical protein